MKALALLCLGLVTSLNAATIAVIDSGTDFTHTSLKTNIWVNPKISSSGSYPFAVFGWNFADKSALVFDSKILATFSPEVKKFIEISSKAFLFTATEDEKTWANEQLKVPGFKSDVSRFSTYVHGTHVSGIAAKNSEMKIMSIKLISTPLKSLMAAEGTKVVLGAIEASKENQALQLEVLLFRIANNNTVKMTEMTSFIADHKADVANGSFGMGIFEAANVAHSAFKAVYKRDPQNQELVDATKRFMKISVKSGAAFVAAAPKTLFVFAAGNDGLSNDDFGSYPSNLKADNTIAVAATFKDQFFAPFSNFGTAMVEVAAPGMMIKSSIPGNDTLEVSGTSQAAPFVANVAGRIKDINPALTPLKIKMIIMGTVDKKDFLKDKVTSGGIVNAERATFAAFMSKVVTIEEAIERANVAVAGKVTKSNGIPVIPRNIEPIAMPGLYE